MFPSYFQIYRNTLLHMQHAQPMLYQYFPNNYYGPITSLANIQTPNTYAHGWVTQPLPVNQYPRSDYVRQMVGQACHYPNSITRTLEQQTYSKMQVQSMNEMLAQPEDNILHIFRPQPQNYMTLAQQQVMDEEPTNQMIAQGLPSIKQQMDCQQVMNLSQNFGFGQQVANYSQAAWGVPFHTNQQIIHFQQLLNNQQYMLDESQEEILKILREQRMNIMIDEAQEQQARQHYNDYNNPDNQKIVNNQQIFTLQYLLRIASPSLINLLQEIQNDLLAQKRLQKNRNATSIHSTIYNIALIQDADLRDYHNTYGYNRHFYGTYKHAQTSTKEDVFQTHPFCTTDPVYNEAEFEQIFKQIKQIQAQQRKAKGKPKKKTLKKINKCMSQFSFGEISDDLSTTDFEFGKQISGF